MSVRLPSGGARRDDDEFLDRIGRGEPVDDGDVERMLSNWRASMPAAGPADERLLDAVAAAVARPRRGHRRLAKVTAGVATAALLAGGGVTAAAAQAGPGSPLWPVTELVFSGLAESRVALDDADAALRDARNAADQGHLPEADRLLAEADELVDKVDEPAAADRLRDDIDTVRERLRRGGPPPHADASRPPGTTSNPASESASSSQPPVEAPSTGKPPVHGPPSVRPDPPSEPPTLPSPTQKPRLGSSTPPLPSDPSDVTRTRPR